MQEEAGWWVLALGGPYDPGDFEQRDAARTRLRQELLLVAIVPDAYVWVWDETDRAQLVLRTFARREAAEDYAAYLSGRGVTARVRQVFGETAGD
ncbi:hypothetical protein [Solidesulfovibrio alcoholivorans]|jgi:hypothetical protein|uniref:hypothetical protein n=1 Tax=Solidesulfovibrio alcoholivorans TaxID=81406 RepID=UPI0004979480|nr:hypothetical protein [Solidesulfovibrio alcoholivorans]HCR13587.1 hypothetical protein [Desulfovibrio sp.]HML59982.1 hypothetical protein [Solidesulfovibrio sp.]